MTDCGLDPNWRPTAWLGSGQSGTWCSSIPESTAETLFWYATERVNRSSSSCCDRPHRAAERGSTLNHLLTAPSAIPRRHDGGPWRMETLPPLSLCIIAAAFGFSSGLGFVLVRALSQFSYRSLWVRSNGAYQLGPERARDEAAIAVPPI